MGDEAVTAAPDANCAKKVAAEIDIEGNDEMLEERRCFLFFLCLFVSFFVLFCFVLFCFVLFLLNVFFLFSFSLL